MFYFNPNLDSLRPSELAEMYLHLVEVGEASEADRIYEAGLDNCGKEFRQYIRDAQNEKDQSYESLNRIIEL